MRRFERPRPQVDRCTGGSVRMPRRECAPATRRNPDATRGGLVPLAESRRIEIVSRESALRRRPAGAPLSAASFRCACDTSRGGRAVVWSRAPREHRLKHVRGIDRDLGRAGDDDVGSSSEGMIFRWRTNSLEGPLSRSSNSPRYFAPEHEPCERGNGFSSTTGTCRARCAARDVAMAVCRRRGRR